MKLDKETQKVLDTQKKVKDFVESEGYQILKKRLMQSVVENSSLFRINIDKNASADMVVTDIKARSLAASHIIQWLSAAEGDAKQYDTNFALLTKTQEDELMVYFPERSEATE